MPSLRALPAVGAGHRPAKRTHLGLLVGLDLFEREQFEFLALDFVFEFELAVV